MHILKPIKGFLWKIPPQKIIVLESIPDYACNTYPVFLELKKMLPDYKLVWYTSQNTPVCADADAVFFTGYRVGDEDRTSVDMGTTLTFRGVVSDDSFVDLIFRQHSFFSIVTLRGVMPAFS